MPQPRTVSTSFIVRGTLVAAGIVLLFLLLWKIKNALLFAFGGILLAVFVRGLSERLARHTPLSMRWATISTGVVIIAVNVGFWGLLGPRIADQFSQLSQQLPNSYVDLKNTLEQRAWGGVLLSYVPESRDAMADEVSLSQVTGAASRAIDALSGALIIFTVGLFFILDPDLYKRGLVRLVPAKRRTRAREVLDALGEALWSWLLGRFVAILFVFVSVALGLWLLDVPLALVLGLIAGILDFVPYVGPVVAALPAILITFTINPNQVLYVGLLYLGVQIVEGNLVTPLIQQRAVSLPPVLTVLALVVFGVLFGVIGIILAVPLLVVAMILVKMLYVEDVLGDEVDVPEGDARPAKDTGVAPEAEAKREG